jgi:adenylosuccinate lyase
MMLLAPAHGRDRAHRLLDEAVSESASSGRSLGEVLAGMEDVTRVLTDAQIRNLELPEDYLGSAETFRTRLLGLD